MCSKVQSSSPLKIPRTVGFPPIAAFPWPLSSVFDAGPATLNPRPEEIVQSTLRAAVESFISSTSAARSASRMAFLNFLGQRRASFRSAPRRTSLLQACSPTPCSSPDRPVAVIPLRAHVRASLHCERLRTYFLAVDCSTFQRISQLADPQTLIEQDSVDRCESADPPPSKRAFPLSRQSHRNVGASCPIQFRLKSPVALPFCASAKLRAVAKRAA